MSKKTSSLRELQHELRKDEEYLQAERQIAPYYDLAKEVIICRLNKKLTQDELAKIAGTHQSRISKIESGEHDVRMSTLIQIADALDSQIKIMFLPIEKYFQDDTPYIELFESRMQQNVKFQYDLADVNY